MFVYVGSRTTRERHARGEGLSVHRLMDAQGTLERVQVLGDLVNPSYLALNAAGTRLYAVHGDRQEVSALAVDRASGRLAMLNQRSTGGRNPVHLALSANEGHLIVTNHLGATVVVLPIDADGALGEVVQSLPFDGPLGPHRSEQTQAKPHFNQVSPDGRLIVVPDKGLDRVFSFRWQAGQLHATTPAWAPAREGAGPRSAVFHPTRPQVYVVNELDNTVTTYAVDAASGALSPRHVVPTLPPGFVGHSRAAGLQIDATGRWLYASNRGHDSLALFRLTADDALPEFVTTVASGGRTPRFFTLSPDGRLLFALNEDSDCIVAFAVDGERGTLTPTGAVTPCGSPVCLVFRP